MYRSYLHFEKNFIHINFAIALMFALAFFLGGIDRSDNEVYAFLYMVLANCEIVCLNNCSDHVQDNGCCHALFLPGRILLDAV